MVNAVLTAAPLYMLSLYKIPVLIRKRIDSIRCRLFCQGSSNYRKKYALISWKWICLSKALGGMGVLDLKIMNTALLFKWW